MKKAARIVFKVESILFIVGLACTAIAALIVSLFIPQIFEGFKDPNNWHPQPAYVSDETAAAMTALCVSGVYIGLVVCILGTIFTLLGIKKIDTARNKKEIMTIGVLNCIFGSRVGAIFLFVTKQTEWPDGQQQQSEY